MVNWEVIVTLGVVGLILLTLLKDWAPTDLVFVSATAVLAGLKIIEPSEAFAGFSNSGMLTVAMLFVISAALRETGVLDRLGTYVLGNARTLRQALLRLAAVVVPMSAFLNNTPIVAMFMPMVIDWGRKNSVSPSKILIPLSYFAILGGTITLIGTSTNLVVNGLLLEQLGPDAGMGLFELAWVGIPYAVIGIALLVIAANWLLPERKELMEQLGESRREYLVEMRVDAACRLIGKSVEDAGLRHLPGLFLVEIERSGTVLGPVGPDEVLVAEDRLIFTGIVNSIMELERIPGLVPAVDPSYEISAKGQRQRRWCEAVVSETSPLIDKTIREADFRATYGAAVLAVHRGGKRIAGKIGDIRMRAGDTLLLQVGRSFLRRHRHDPAFYLISDVENPRPLRTDRIGIALTLFAILLVLMTTGVMDTLVACGLIAVAMVATGCLSIGQARESVEWQVLIAIAAAFGVGTAIDKSGAAEWVAGGLVQLSQTLGGPITALLLIYLTTMLVTELITNNAAALLMFPFALKTAEIYEVEPRPFIIALTLAASASFVTPIGYQTNMMVYGPGGYRFSDFMRVGLPISLLLAVVAMILIPWIWPLTPVTP
ncbi:MAG: SLC13 family permease [Planctomycetales bacterium]|nr:SLC13 family permease [Planctomycetales bacterium]